MKGKLRQLVQRFAKVARPVGAGAGAVAGQGLISKVLTLRDLLHLGLHSGLAAIVIFGGFWADFGIALYLVGLPLMRIGRRLALF
ncbi:MAG: hypothetical protein OXI69_15445 [Acidobacteriota bacterium]|nr:hypothetical protein [Acidobacteriota bacterium]